MSNQNHSSDDEELIDTRRHDFSGLLTQPPSDPSRATVGSQDIPDHTDQPEEEPEYTADSELSVMGDLEEFFKVEPDDVLDSESESDDSEADPNPEDPEAVIVEAEQAKAKRGLRRRSKPEKTREPLEPSERRTRLIEAAVVAGIVVGSFTCLGLVNIFSGIPLWGPLSITSISTLFAVIGGWGGFELFYPRWTPPEEQKSHKAVQVAVLFDGIVVLIACALSIYVSPTRIVCIPLMVLIIGLPILLRWRRGSLAEREAEAAYKFSHEYITASRHVHDVLDTTTKIRNQDRDHPIAVLPLIPIAVLLTWGAYWLGHHVLVYVPVAIWLVGIAVLFVHYLKWRNDEFVHTDTGMFQVFGVIKEKQRGATYGDVKNSTLEYTLVSQWLAGNRYIATRYARRTYDTASQDDNPSLPKNMGIKVRRYMPHGGAAKAFEDQQKAKLTPQLSGN